MVYSLILLVPRKSGVTSAEFKYYWETRHVPLLKKLVGHDFPLSHTRHYLERRAAAGTHHDGNDRPNVTIGGPEAEAAIDYDGLAVLTFIDRSHHARFMEKLQDRKAHETHESDLERFVDVERLMGVMADTTAATGRDGGEVGWRFVGSV